MSSPQKSQPINIRKPLYRQKSQIWNNSWPDTESDSSMDEDHTPSTEDTLSIGSHSSEDLASINEYLDFLEDIRSMEEKDFSELRDLIRKQGTE